MSDEVSGPRWLLTLYVSGASRHSFEAIETVRRICDDDLAGVVDLTVVNARDHPDLVQRDHVLAVPTLVKHAPPPLRNLVGDLHDVERVRLGLDLGPAPSAVRSPAEGAPLA